MIKDNIRNIDRYKGISSALDFAIEHAKKLTTDIKSGRYELLGKSYLNICRYETSPETDAEYHKKYTDFQYVLKGEELFGVADVNALEDSVEYDDEKDIGFKRGHVDYMLLTEGDFVIVFPWDAHTPGVMAENKCKMEKAVYKIAECD